MKTAAFIMTVSGFIFGLTPTSNAGIVNDGYTSSSSRIVQADKCKPGEVMDKMTKKCVKK